MKAQNIKTLLITLIMITMALSTWAQRVIIPKKKKSPLSMAVLKKDDNYIKVTYGQPFKREREIFGKLVPYEKVWRTGANEATEITTLKDIKIGDNTLKAGTYTIFTIPTPTDWTIILNGELGQWGNFSYDKVKEKDILIFKVPSQKIKDIYEAFTIKFKEDEGGATLQLIWDSTEVNIPIKFIL